MRILVTGGAGFIGSHVTDAYIEAGHEVLVIDNLVTGKQSNLNENARFEQLSIQDPIVEDLFLRFKPHVVNHHAAHINLRQSVVDPMFDAENNIIGSLNILKSAARTGVKKIIFASTGGAIYGDPQQIPVPETVQPMPLSPYGASKLAIEHYIRIWKHIHDIDYTIFRYPNIFGPRQDPKGEAGVVAIFSLQITHGETPRIFGDGSKTRDYLFIEDLVRANMKALDAGCCETLNLGWGREISDREVFDTVSKALDYREEPEYVSVRAGEVYRIALDAAKAADILDWKPEVSFPDGVERTVHYYSEEKTI